MDLFQRTGDFCLWSTFLQYDISFWLSYSFLEAYNIFRTMQQKDESHYRCCDVLVKALLAENCLDEALDVKRM